MGNYLVTGAAGFIGARVCDLLLNDGHHVVGLDNLNNAYDVRLKEWRLSRLNQRENFLLQRQDITRWDTLQKTVEANGPFDGIINLAARAGVRASVENPWIFLETNTTGTLNLLEAARKYQIPKFVLASTSSIYGEDAPQPTPETADSSKPLQPYSASKKGAEAMAHAYHYLHGVDVTIFRYFTVYGPAGRPDMVMFRFVQWISEGRPVLLNGDGNQSRGFTYVDDIARGTIAGLKPLGYEIINLGGHEPITMNAMIEQLEGLIGCKANVTRRPLHKADMLSNLADVSKARRMLGWEPQVGLLEGMRRLVEWYQAERSWASQIVTE
ncbi:MAG TPA: SDR family NAD(P)-dependent oxidoreductase [Anaerolineaceae bacterium]